MKTKFKVLITLIAIFVCSTMAAFVSACSGGDNNGITGSGNGRVPVYQGMTISKSVSKSSTSATAMPLASNGNSGNNGNHYGWYKDKEVDQDEPFGDTNESIEDVIDSTLTVTGSVAPIYYATPNEDILITVHINNPDDFEILSFTLNNTKYSSYMFEYGSDMENLILKVNVGNVSGIVEYTIDQIKYVEGTEIKDVLIGGDQTVLTGVRIPNQVNATVTDTIGFNDISLNVNISDNDGLIEYSKGTLKAVLYDGTKLIAEKALNLGNNSVVFDGLDVATLYQYAIVGYYDNLEYGCDWNLLYKNATYTETPVIFDNISVTQEGIFFDFTWHQNAIVSGISTLRLIKGDEVQNLVANVGSVEGLLSNNDYTLAATYSYNGKDVEIYYAFHTLTKATPNLSVTTNNVTQTGFGFNVDVTDTDDTGRITKVELLSGDEVQKQVETSVRSFVELVSYTNYTVRITYTYDLNDGEGEQTIIETANTKTLGADHAIIYHLNGGVNSAQSPQSFNEAETTTLSNATREYYTFIGWCTDESLTAVLTSIPECTRNDVHLYAKWAYGTEGLQYSLSGGTYTVTGYNGTDTKVAIPEEWNGYSVTAIGISAFWNCSSFTDVIIGNNITVLGDTAFRNCTSLESLIIGESVNSIGYNAFSFCKSLATVYWKATNCTSAGSDNYLSIFSNSTALKTVIIGDNVQTIPNAAFYDCKSLNAVYITDIASWCKISLGGGSANPLRYAHNLYVNNSLITELTIPNDVTAIGNYAFYGCTSIESVTIGNGVTVIGEHAFEDCTNIKSAIIGNSVISIGSLAFWNCYKLIEVWNYSSLNIQLDNNYLFGYVARYALAVYNDDEESRRVTTDDGYIFFEDENGAYLLGYLGEETDLLLPQKSPKGNNYEIYHYAFYECSNLMSIVIPDSVTAIGDYAFYNCSRLSFPNMTIGNCVTSIGSYAFTYCYGISILTISRSVAYIARNAFYYCSNLLSVTFEEPTGWTVSGYVTNEQLASSILSSGRMAAECLKDTYCEYEWWR